MKTSLEKLNRSDKETVISSLLPCGWHLYTQCLSAFLHVRLPLCQMDCFLSCSDCHVLLDVCRGWSTRRWIVTSRSFSQQVRLSVVHCPLLALHVLPRRTLPHSNLPASLFSLDQILSCFSRVFCHQASITSSQHSTPWTDSLTILASSVRYSLQPCTA